MKYGRLHWFLREELDDRQRDYYDQLMAGPRDSSSLADDKGRLFGAFNPRLLDPPVGTAIQELGAALRFGAQLPARSREIVILEVARSERCEYEWSAHVKAARKAGLSETEIEAVRTGAITPSLSAQEAVVRLITQALATGGDLSDEQFAVAEQTIGLVQLFDVISLVGHYQHTAMALRVWRTPPRDSSSPAFAPLADGGADDLA